MSAVEPKELGKQPYGWQLGFCATGRLAIGRRMPSQCHNRGSQQSVWGGQSCPQPPFRRHGRAIDWPSTPAKSRRQPGLAAPHYGKVNGSGVSGTLRVSGPRPKMRFQPATTERYPAYFTRTINFPAPSGTNTFDPCLAVRTYKPASPCPAIPSAVPRNAAPPIPCSAVATAHSASAPSSYRPD